MNIALLIFYFEVNKTKSKQLLYFWWNSPKFKEKRKPWLKSQYLEIYSIQVVNINLSTLKMIIHAKLENYA